jgi:hypothetical protein
MLSMALAVGGRKVKEEAGEEEKRASPLMERRMGRKREKAVRLRFRGERVGNQDGGMMLSSVVCVCDCDCDAPAAAAGSMARRRA